MEHLITPAPWEPYADESEHYSYVRCLDMGNIYEVVRVSHDKYGQQAEFVHRIIFMSEYDKPALDEILREFDYEGLDDFVSEVNGADVDPAGFSIRKDGSVDRAASPSWWIDYMLLASLMAEYFHGRRMSVQAADALARSVVGESPARNSPFCIYRTFLDQMMSIPLLEAEVNAIWAVKDEQARKTYLCEEISDLDKDDPSFGGHSQEKLLDDPELLAAVQKRWYHYNGHGGDPTENLREAIKITLADRGGYSAENM